MMGQMPQQMQNSEGNGQNPQVMPMGMMGQFPQGVQMGQQLQGGNNQGQGSSGMPVGYPMMMNQ